MNYQQPALFETTRYPTMTRDERKQQILDILRITDRQMTITEIARACGLRTSPYIRKIIADLDSQGLIELDYGTLTNGLPVTLIEIA